MVRDDQIQPADVVVIGGGVIGLSVAEALLSAGRGVTVVERDRIGEAASHGNCGLVTPSMAVPLTRPGVLREALAGIRSRRAPLRVRPRVDPAFLGWALRFAHAAKRGDLVRTTMARGELLASSVELFDAWQASGWLDCEWEHSGTYFVFDTEAQREEAAAFDGLLAELGIGFEDLDAEALLAAQPCLRPGPLGARRFPGDACLRPEELILSLAKRVRELGGVIVEGAPVMGVRVGRDSLDKVVTTVGTFGLNDVVLAAGAWCPALVKPLGVRLPITAGRGYSTTVVRGAGAPTAPLVLESSHVAITPFKDGVRLGGTMEFAPLGTRPDPTRIDGLLKAGREALVDPLDGRIEERWSGPRPMSADELPFIGRGPGARNGWLAAGHGMLGVSMAPATARLLAELMTGTEPHIDPAPFDPARVVRGEPDRSVPRASRG